MNKKIASVLASVMMLMQVAPVAAATTISISGNGTGSDNTVRFDTDNKTSVTQVNEAKVYNNIDASANTGNNDANRNTGGLVEINTGDATTDVAVVNQVNSNSASVDCCASANNVDVLISGNGADSDNYVDLDVNQSRKSGTTVNQWNTANVTNKVNADANTGRNDADRNTGGDVSIDTGNASTSVALTNTANANSARIGGNGAGEDGLVSLRILGNGDDSDNDIRLDLDSAVVLEQGNRANIYNRVDADADTGYNDANRNTGGEVSITTGDATVDVVVDNMTNFNAADVECGCVFDVLAKIDGNGSDSDNDIRADLDGRLDVGQFNSGRGVYNRVDADADTGGNDADRNTGEVDGDSDPSIETGDAETTVEVVTTGNSNLFGQGFEFDFGWPSSGFNFNFSFDLESLLDALMDMMN